MPILPLFQHQSLLNKNVLVHLVKLKDEQMNCIHRSEWPELFVLKKVGEKHTGKLPMEGLAQVDSYSQYCKRVT